MSPQPMTSSARVRTRFGREIGPRDARPRRHGPMSGEGSVRQRNHPLRLLPQSPPPGPSDEGRGGLRERPSAVPKRCSAISGAIPIGSPSATSASSVAKTTSSASAGGTTRMGTRPRSCASRSRNSSVGFSFMCSPRASCASGTMASSPIATAPSTWPPVWPSSMRLLRRLPNPKPSRPSSLAYSGPMSTAAPTVVKDGRVR